MKRLVILGAGTAGTMMANHLNHHLANQLANHVAMNFMRA
jgi:NADH dehydrogenase FAD-containing subunit